MSLDCATKYPIVLVHGVAIREMKRISVWGKIPKVLQEHGATVLYGGQDAWDTIENNAEMLKKNISDICKWTRRDKVNIIAHSKGGLDARYMISSLQMSDRVASLTTISSPHHGLKYVDYLINAPKILYAVVGFCVWVIYKLRGDKHPKFRKVIQQFTTDYASKFNENNVDCDGVYYQSYCTYLKKGALINKFINKFDGKNDGIVACDSSVWAKYRGVIGDSYKRGLSHNAGVGLMGLRFRKYDILSDWVNIVRELKDKGF